MSAVASRLGWPALIAVGVLLPFALNASQLSTATFILIATIGAVGLNVLTGYTGQISLGHAFFLAVGAYTAAVLGAGGASALLWIPAAGLAAALCGALIGPTALRLRGLHLAVVTIGLVFIGQHVLFNAPGVSGGPAGRTFPSVVLGPFDFSPGQELRVGAVTFDRDGLYYYLALALVVVAMAFVANLMRSRAGRAMQAVRERETAAALMGVSLARTKVAASTISALLAGIAGALSQPQPHVEAFNQISKDIAILSSFGSPTTKAIQPMLGQQKLVTLPLSWDSAWAKDPVLAPVGTPYSIDVANAIDCVINERGEKDAKFGIVYQNDEYGQDGLRGYEAALKEYGFDDVARTTYKVGDTEFTSQVQKLKNAGAQYVIVTSLPSSAGPIVGTGASLGYNPKWILQGPAWIEFLMTKDGTADGAPTPVAKALERNAWVVQIASTWGDDTKPGMKQFLADAQAHAPKQVPDPYFIYGYVQGRVQQAILEKAIASKDLTRQGIYNAKLSIGEIDVGGLVPPVRYSKDLVPSSRETQLAQVDRKADGFLKPLAQPFQGEAAAGL